MRLGEVAEMGTHAELLAIDGGLYQEMWSKVNDEFTPRSDLSLTDPRPAAASWTAGGR